MKPLDKRLRNIWADIKKRPHARDVDNFLLFREWAYGHGYGEETLLRKINEDLPYSKDNCAWTTPEKAWVDDLRYAAARWDRFVDGVRIRCGLGPIITTNPCAGCPRAKKCDDADSVCETRKRYWDVKMAQIRKRNKEEL